MRIAILHGPNLNLLGVREPEKYGHQSLNDLYEHLQNSFSDIEFDFFQSNHEGELIDQLHAWRGNIDGLVINPGGLAHSSVSLADAIKLLPNPTIEVHITNVFAREAFRHTLVTASACMGCISGLGTAGYQIAVTHLKNVLS
jgi:3-dehydroquinate dehydratase-2